MKFNYENAYNNFIDIKRIEKQFQLYDIIVKEYYKPEKIFNDYYGGENLVHLGNLKEEPIVKNIKIKLCSTEDVTNLMFSK